MKNNQQGRILRKKRHCILALFSLCISIRLYIDFRSSSRSSLYMDFRSSSRNNNNGVLVTEATEAQQMHVYESLCKKLEATKGDKDWLILCDGMFVQRATQLLMSGEQISIVQIGAHTGFEENDPISKGLTGLLDKVTSVNISGNNELRKNFRWTFVEPSPPNFKRLSKNLLKHSDVCDMRGINAGVVSDLTTNADEMIFYSIRDTIDPETGFDSLSNQSLPVWITQVSSFSKEPILFNRGVFRRKNLNVNDYIVKTNVTTVSFSDLMKQVLITTKEASERIDQVRVPLLVLIDTEGYDCNIVEGISPSSPFLPEYIMFEHKQCKDKEATYKHLQNMGYSVQKPMKENTIAFKNS